MQKPLYYRLKNIWIVPDEKKVRRILYPERSYRDFAVPPPPPPRAAPDVVMGLMIKFVFFVDNAFVDFCYRRMMISRGKRVQ